MLPHRLVTNYMRGDPSLGKDYETEFLTIFTGTDIFSIN